ncbi:MAG: hypothetical protein WD847_03620 [Pirellulales bacterium]
MASDLEKLLDEVRALPPEDQRRIRTLLDEQLSAQPLEPPRSPEEEFHRRLVEVGLLKEVKPPVRDLEPYRHRRPFEFEGKPVSETIIEERR